MSRPTYTTETKPHDPRVALVVCWALGARTEVASLPRPQAELLAAKLRARASGLGRADRARKVVAS